MPTVPVTDLVVHPREHDLIVAATAAGCMRATSPGSGRSRRARSTKTCTSLRSADEAAQRGRMGHHDLYGDRFLRTPNEPNGLVFDIT
jgi:hypothetical protein